MFRRSAAIACAVGLACSEPTTPDETRDVRLGQASTSYVVPAGRRVIRLGTTCPGCTSSHFIVSFLFAGRARPPISLTLVADGKTLTSNSHERCFEDEVPRTTPPSQCTLLVAHGWDKLDDARDARTFDLIIDNDGPARDATLGLDLESVPRD